MFGDRFNNDFARARPLQLWDCNHDHVAALDIGDWLWDAAEVTSKPGAASVEEEEPAPIALVGGGAV